VIDEDVLVPLIYHRDPVRPMERLKFPSPISQAISPMLGLPTFHVRVVRLTLCDEVGRQAS
jgi:hypothetical protein